MFSAGYLRITGHVQATSHFICNQAYKNADHTLQELRQLSDNDLANIVYAPAPEVVYPDKAKRLDFTACIPYFPTELKRTGVTRLLLWEEYRKEYNNPYRYTQFCILLKEASKVTQATMHLIHAPAAIVMVDFAGDKMSYVDDSTGELICCPVLDCVLPFSKYTFTTIWLMQPSRKSSKVLITAFDI